MTFFKKSAALISLSVLLALTLSTSAHANNPIPDSPVIKELRQSLIEQHQFDAKTFDNLIDQTKFLPDVVARITKPAEGLPWHRYRNIFVKQKRIEQGVEFWNEHAETLAKAEQHYGIPAEIIVAILGVETRYGRHRGGFRVIDSLATLAVDYPRRSKFFARELKEFLILTRDEKLDPLSVVGSYAGAMGKPQFIASSYRNYAVDFDGDGIRDLLNNTDDAIGSVANYFKRHGWVKGQPITTPANVSGAKYSELVKKGIKPKLSLSEISQYGVTWANAFEANAEAALIELDLKDGKEHWLGFKNFYVITRYNHSQLYAMAVYQLSQEIVKLRGDSVQARAD